MNLGRAIKLYRTQCNLSQLDLATLAGLSVSYVSLLERNKRDPALSTIEKIAAALDVPVILLLFLAVDKDELSEGLREKLSLAALDLTK